MNIALVLVNYNNSILTINCVESIYYQHNFKGEIYIVIVDNNSVFEEKKILSDWNRNNHGKLINLLFLDDNIGYFPAINKGLISVNPLSEYRYTIVGNNDLEFDKSFLKNLDKTIYDENIFVIAPNIIRSDGLHQNPFFINRISILRKIYYKIYYLNYYSAIIIEYLAGAFKLRKIEKDKVSSEVSQYIYMGFGACYILTNSFLEKCGKLKDDVFLFGEEAMLGYQISEKNGKIFYDSSLIVNHIDHSTIKKIPSKRLYHIAKKSYNIYKKYL